jgi:hypothetical protein
MEDRRYVTPGFMAIIAAGLTLPMIVLGLILDIAARKNPGFATAILLPYLLVVGAQAICGLYAFGRLKTYLNERHGFHEVDGLIVAIVIGACVMTLIGITARIALVALGVERFLAISFVVLLVTLGIPLAILGIVFAVKLLRVDSDQSGLLRPFAIVNIVASVCFASFILAPLGLLLDAAGNVLLGMIYLRRKQEPATPEFV